MNFNNFFDYVTAKETLIEKTMKNSVCATPQEVVIPLQALIFFNKILYLYSQKVELTKIYY